MGYNSIYIPFTISKGPSCFQMLTVDGEEKSDELTTESGEINYLNSRGLWSITSVRQCTTVSEANTEMEMSCFWKGNHVLELGLMKRSAVTEINGLSKHSESKTDEKSCLLDPSCIFQNSLLGKKVLFFIVGHFSREELSCCVLSPFGMRWKFVRGIPKRWGHYSLF